MTYTPAIAEYLRAGSENLGHQILNVESQRFYDGFWHGSFEANWNQELNTGALAACMWRYAAPDSNTPIYRQMALDTIERAFRLSYYNVPGTPYYRFSFALEGSEETTNTSDTINFEVISALNGIIHYLGDSVPRKQRREWLAKLANTLDYYSTINYPWYYINGNYAFHLAANYWELAENFRLTGDQANWRKWMDIYQIAWDVMISPYPTIAIHFNLYEADGVTPNILWQGFGLVVDGGTQNDDWSNYITHLSETPSGPTYGVPPANTWDPAYSLLTMDLFACHYVRNRDYRLNRLLNAEFNKLSPLINTTTWVIDANFGSRQSGFRGYNGAWLQVMYLIGGRTLNRTMFTELNMQNSWVQAVANLTSNLANGQNGPAAQRQYQIAVACLVECTAKANRSVL